MIVFGEMLIGLGLLVGALVGIAAFFGAVMNMSFLLSGSISVNPIFLTMAILLIMGWKVAGWFGLDRVGKLEIVCAEAETAIAGLAQAGRRFDYVMEDVTYADEPEVALPKLLAMVPLVTPRGSLVINRHRHGDPKPMARTLRFYFGEVKIRRVRRTGENTLICCSRPLVSRAGGV